MSKWNDEQMNQFVLLYKRHDCLWDTNSSKYKNKVERNIALQSIVTEMNIHNFGIMDCKNKIKNMRSHYWQELKKIQESKNRGESVENIYKPKLIWFDQLNRYLRKYVQLSSNSVKNKETVSESQLDDSNDIVNEDEKHGHSIFYMQPEDKFNKLDCYNEKRDNGFQNKSIKTSSKNSHLSTTTKKRKVVKKSDLNMDTSRQKWFTLTEFDVFGQSVAAQLNNIPIVDAMKLQLQIQQLITHHRLEMHCREPPNPKNHETKSSLRNPDSDDLPSCDFESDIKSEADFTEEPWSPINEEETPVQCDPSRGHEIFLEEVEPKLEPEDEIDTL